MKNLTNILVAAVVLALPITSLAYYRYNTEGSRAEKLNLYTDQELSVQSAEGWPQWIGRIEDRSPAYTSSVTFGALLDQVLQSQIRYSEEDIDVMMASDWPDWIDPPWWMWFLQ